MRLLQNIAGVGISFFLFTTQLPAAPHLESDSDSATAGYFQLSWSANMADGFILQEAASPEFSNASILYQGPDTATLVSGKADGTYYYRIRNTTTPAEWSNITKVTVTHHPLSRAFMFFILGALVFVATLVMVIRGNRTYRQ